MFHIYVDPIFGDDAQARVLNPWRGQVLEAGRFHPDTTVIPTPDQTAGWRTASHIGGLAMHAPYSFRTIVGAIEYACMAGGSATSGETWILGMVVDATTNPVKRIAWIVIHCLPGIYRQDTSIDPISGLPGNGEGFPIELPYGISLQGTSALDTILDVQTPNPFAFDWNGIDILEPGRGTEMAPGNNRGFLVEHPYKADPGVTPAHPSAGLARTFIDGFTIRGTELPDRASTATYSNKFQWGAGIRMIRRIPWGNESIPLRPVVSNCFINHCGVGVAVIAARDAVSPWTWRPIILNNTFADNLFVNLYNGSIPVLQNWPSIGINLLRVTNNIFVDPSPVDNGFAGMHAADVRALRGGVPFVCNAYQALPGSLLPNTSASWPATPTSWTALWPAALVDPNRPLLTPPNIAPVVDLAALSSDAFFVNRVIAPLSAHDYRLAPWSWAVFDPLSDPTGMLNPMVNRGITLDPVTGTIDFANGLSIDGDGEAAGLPRASSDAYATIPSQVQPFQLFDAWDTDAEGFANPRVAARAPFPAGPLGDVDLGADEMGSLLIAGYIDHTRLFARMNALPWWVTISPPITQTQMYFLDLPGFGSYTRPIFNTAFGGFFPGAHTDWFVNVQTNPVPPPASSPPIGNLGTAHVDLYGADMPTWRSEMLVQNQKVLGNVGSHMTNYVMRNLMCDFSPLLAPDFKPLWAHFGDIIPGTYSTQCTQFPGGLPGFSGWDHYAANPWINDFRSYSHQRQPGGLGDPLPGPCDLTIAIDNPFAFYNPPPGFPRMAGQTPTWISNVTSGILNPPGTYIDLNMGNPAGIAPRLDVSSFPIYGSGIFGPFAPCVATSSTTYDVSQWGVGDVSTGCPDEIPDFLWAQGVGIRVNCMRGVNFAGFGTGNLQTFLIYSRTVPTDDQYAQQGTDIANGTSAQMGATSSRDRVRPSTRDRLRSGLLHLIERLTQR